MEENKFENIKGIKHLEERNEIERKAIEIAINKELKENRKIIIAPIGECYDIISTKESYNFITIKEMLRKSQISINVRFIKVYASEDKIDSFKLTRREFYFAKTIGKRYWIYLINMKNEKPIILKTRSPAYKLKYKVIEVSPEEKYYLFNIHKLLGKFEKVKEDIRHIEVKSIPKILKIIKLIEKRIIERKAMEIAIEEERKENRKVIVVSEKEHYDILSIGNNPEDIRHIEVKGMSKPKPILLKEKEFDFGKEHGNKYWIYLVNIIEDKGIKILKIKDPINKLEWRKERIDKKKGKKLYLFNVYGLLNNNIDENDLKIVSLEKENIITKDKIKEMIIKGLNALKNINNISKEDEEVLRELGLIKYMGGKITLTSSGIRLLKLIRNQKLKEEELYELLKKEQGKIPFIIKKVM
jgi:hypothetical protein